MRTVFGKVVYPIYYYPIVCIFVFANRMYYYSSNSSNELIVVGSNCISSSSCGSSSSRSSSDVEISCNFDGKLTLLSYQKEKRKQRRRKK